MLAHATLPSPIGPITVVASPDAVVAIHLGAGLPRLASQPTPGHPLLDAAARQLREYFAGARRAFELPLGGAGTAFQRDVWRALCAIPFGVTCGYAELAARLGRPTAARAVGAANGKNPIAIVVPCHRVIGKDGTLTGYAGGVAIKQWLLEHEARVGP
ncbi:MAG: methylated-DNA--[protein]-cysteine S-methyltransferase [Myxococcales bacterium]|nr:methylated-DNA--[protein]-cysteine S-methyltransferase [Myxococcales bacterium]